MANFDTKFSSIKQTWETPDSVFKPLDTEFHFTLDVCASKINAKCSNYYTEEQDALKQNWEGICWMNPPFKQVGKWIKKAYEESRKGATVVCLVASRTNTNWWHDYCMKGEIRYIRGRPIFKGNIHGLPQPLAIIIFKKVI
jgi:phage N-6-adenine-methyltransferase